MDKIHKSLLKIW